MNTTLYNVKIPPYYNSMAQRGTIYPPMREVRQRIYRAAKKVVESWEAEIEVDRRISEAETVRPPKRGDCAHSSNNPGKNRE